MSLNNSSSGRAMSPLSSNAKSASSTWRGAAPVMSTPDTNPLKGGHASGDAQATWRGMGGVSVKEPRSSRTRTMRR
eukprot:2486030-Rhodomonas_salina.2